MAFAAEPADGRGEAMLKALRDRDAAAHWDAAGAALPPLPPPVVESVVEPDFAPEPTAGDGAAWRTSRDATGRAALRPYPDPLRLAQEEPFVPYEEPPALGSEPTEDESLGIDEEVRPIARTPDQLRKIGEILPYHDYEPDPDVDDPCLYLCPRPDGLPCKEYAAGEIVPPCPEEVGLGDEPFVPRAMPPSVFAWKASNVHYNPLYFEDVQLERYGHSYGDCVQPFVSLGKFSVQLVGLPYQMALDPPCKDIYPLGYYRPGEPAPKLFYQVPLNARAAAVAAGFYTGVGVILP